MFEITYHHKIPDDIKSISASMRLTIQKAIEAKLTTAPEFFGKPLQFSLKGCRTMRVGDYRVIFQLKTSEVFIIQISHRSVVYSNIQKRI
jgi:mRNA interferase RelE/StbE